EWLEILEMQVADITVLEMWTDQVHQRTYNNVARLVIRYRVRQQWKEWTFDRQVHLIPAAGGWRTLCYPTRARMAAGHCYSGLQPMLQQTIEEQERYRRWHRRSARAMTPRRLLQESDELLFWVEECQVQRIRIVPGWLIPRLMNVLRHAHPQLPARLGRERRP